MLGDSQRYEAKRLEIEQWMQRMESRAERMGIVATTADMLEVQQKEQKVRNNFKVCQCDLFACKAFSLSTTINSLDVNILYLFWNFMGFESF